MLVPHRIAPGAELEMQGAACGMWEQPEQEA